MKQYISIDIAITIMYQLLSRFMNLYDSKNAQIATEYIQQELKRYDIINNDDI